MKDFKKVIDAVKSMGIKFLKYCGVWSTVNT